MLPIRTSSESGRSATATLKGVKPGDMQQTMPSATNLLPRTLLSITPESAIHHPRDVAAAGNRADLALRSMLVWAPCVGQRR